MKSVGERIRYFRYIKDMTQEQLAENSGIHPVSIRKYETNKMQPQIEQIERIASALDVNTSALIGYNSSPMQIKTIGDFFGVLMTLFKARALMIAGEKDPKDFFLRRDNVDIKPETMFFKLNPALHSLFDAVVINDFDKGEITKGQFGVDRLGLMFNNLEYAKDFVSWALTYDAFDHFTHADDETDPGAGALKYFSVTLEETELRLLSITTPLPEYGIKPLAAQYVLNENPEDDEE